LILQARKNLDKSKIEVKRTLLFSNFDAPDLQKLRRIQNFASKIEKKSNYAQLLCARLF